MVVSHREGSISSNIRAIIEQLNLNPVETRRLIDRTKQDGARCKGYQGVQPTAKISIGVYGCKEKVEYEIPAPIRRVCRLEDRPRPKQETGQRKILCSINNEAAENDAVEVIDQEKLASVRTCPFVVSYHCVSGFVERNLYEAPFPFYFDDTNVSSASSLIANSRLLQYCL